MLSPAAWSAIRFSSQPFSPVDYIAATLAEPVQAEPAVITGEDAG
jgi:hypothetical protein